MHRRDRQIPGYALGDVLGHGAMGTVWRATHVATGADVALKLVVPGSERERAALESEVLAMARLNHPALLYLHDFGHLNGDDGGLWMALELASGGALEGWIPPDWPSLWEVLDPLLAGLSHAHAHGLVHRDLKPANLLRATASDHRPGVKIGDFGLAMVRGIDAAIQRGGTPLYMPPEQYRKGFGAIGPWSDLYALGAVVWHWATGRPPFSGGPRALMRQHAVEAPPAFEPRFAVPDALEPLLRELLRKQASERPTQVAALRRALDGVPSDPRAAILATAQRSGSARLPGIGTGLLPLRDWRVVGRDDERAWLLDALDEVRRSQQPQVRWLTGPQGSGTSRLVRWLAEAAAECGVAEVVWSPSDVWQARERSHHGVVLVCFDEPSPAQEELVATLAFSRRPILTLATHAAAAPRAHVLPNESVRVLGPMRPGDVRDLLHSELGLTGALSVRVAGRCAGNPGRAIAWTVELAGRGLLQPSADGFELTTALEGLAPPDLEAPQLPAIQRIVDGPAEAWRSMRLAALLGIVVASDEWRAVLAGAALPRPTAAVRTLLRAGHMRQAEGGLVWADPHARDALLTPPAAAAEHGVVARALGEVPPNAERTLRRGLHLVAAGQHSQGRVLLLTLEHATRWQDAEQLREVVDAFRGAMDGATTQQRCCLALMELRVMLNLVSGRAALPGARHLLKQVGHPSAPGPWWPELSTPMRIEALEFVARVFAFEEQADDALKLLVELPRSPATLRCRALALSTQHRFREAEGLLRQALGEATDPRQQARIANGLGSTLSRAGRADQALVWFERSNDLLEPALRYTPQGNMAMALLTLGRPAQALPHARSAYQLARHHGMRRLAFPAILYAVCAAACDEQQLDAIGDLALFCVKRYGLGDGHLVTERLRGIRPERPATQAFVDAMIYALDHAAPSAS